jgi:hypothetical protein
METTVPKYEKTLILCRKILITEAAVVSNKETFIEVNAEKTKCMACLEFRIQDKITT